MKTLIQWVLAASLSTIAMAADQSFVFAGLSITPEPWDKAANMAKLERFATEAAARGANVISTPEGFLEGYVGNRGHTPGLTREAYANVTEELNGPLLTRVGDLARKLKIHLLVGFAERRGDKFYNTAVIFSPDGKVVSRYSKMHTGGGEPFNTKGTEFVVADTPYGPWGTLICYDRQLLSGVTQNPPRRVTWKPATLSGNGSRVVQRRLHNDADEPTRSEPTRNDYLALEARLVCPADRAGDGL